MKQKLSWISFIFCCHLAWADRVLQLQAYPPAQTNNLRLSAAESVTLLSGYEVNIELTNHSSITQTGTVELLASESNIAVSFMQKNTTGSGYRSLGGDYLSFVCGGRGGTSAYAQGTGATPSWPSPQQLKLNPNGSTSLSVGAIFYKALAANDNVTNTNGKFVPTIRLKINEDRGAVSGYVLAINRTYSGSAYGTCAGNGLIPESPKIESSWTFEPGTPREINGGRPF